ncbi:unnamed protein product [Adineta ricciae]|uniref:Uncharacterized protein n=1 Tax=Adineta ricciae TaxID=249248 RepID=A0A814H7Y7_ADIRI|nr:unnamed protein product [Adineta ricciae]
MMMDTTVDTEGTAFICPECNWNARSLPELMSHLNDTHSEETATKSEAPPKNISSVTQPEKRSRRKPAFSHQIISQASRDSSTLFNQRNSLNTESDSNELWTHTSTLDRNDPPFLTTNTDDSSISFISDENTNINMNSKLLPNCIPSAKRNSNVLHSILSQQRPIAPKNGSPTATKIAPMSSPLMNSSPTTDNSFYSPTNHSIQAYRKNFQCRMCRLTYKNFHDCTAHIRKKHEISHAQAGQYVEKLDTDAPLPPSATGNYKFRVKVKSLPPQQQLNNLTTKRNSLTPDFKTIFQCKYCSFTSHWSQEISKHQRSVHPTYPPHILQQEYSNDDQEINNSTNDDDDDDDDNDNDEGYSALLVDPIRAFGEVIDSNETTDENDCEDMECPDEELLIEHDVDDDEDDALWKYQQEINDTPESDLTITNNNNNQLNYSFAKQFKKFRCPHCEHSAPTLTKLKLHVATHINIKPFMCSICGWRANLRWYIQCHAKKRHPNMSFEVLQLSHEEAEQTISAYMKERGMDSKLNTLPDSKRRFQCNFCQFRSSHPKFLEQHIATNHPNRSFPKSLLNKPQTINGHAMKLTNQNDDQLYSKFMIKPLTKKLNGDYHEDKQASQALYNRSSLIQSDGTVILPDPSQIVYPNFSSHANFNSNRLFYCALCYRGYRWRYDVKRHHKTMHETPEDEAAMGLSMSPKSVKRRNKEFNRNFRYLEYVPQLDGLIQASMSSVNNQQHHHHHRTNHNARHHDHQNQYPMKQGNGFDDETLLDNASDDEGSQDGDLKLNIADGRTVDITEDEAAALLMIEPHKSDNSSSLITDHADESIIVFDDDRFSLNKSSDLSKSLNRSSSGFKPYRCPYCFYRTNWRTDSLRHIRARHKIEPTQDGYYEMTPEEAESTYAEYERTFGFVVSKKVLGRFTDFRHMEWKDLQRSIWDKIKDKQGYEQIIYDRLRPDNYVEATRISPAIAKQTIAHTSINVKTLPLPMKSKRMFTCMECAFRSYKLIELDKHICAQFQKSNQRKAHGKFLISLYHCTKCSYRTIYKNYVRKHIHLHHMRDKKQTKFHYCSFCGYNHLQRSLVSVHIARQHPMENMSTTTKSCQTNMNADFSIKQINLRRSFIANQLDKHQTKKSSIFYCSTCPHISTSVLEHDHHQSCHAPNPINLYKCSHCTFASNSLLYTHQHNLLHSRTSRLLSLHTDTKNLKHLSMSMIHKETLGKNRRYHCPYCQTYSSSTSSKVLNHIKNTHTENSSQFDNSLLIGSDMAKEILALGKTVTNDQHMDLS